MSESINSELLSLECSKEDKTIISISWCVQDVAAVAEGQGRQVTLEDCKKVLMSLLDNHDANEGISWDTLDTTMDNVLGEMP